MSIDLAQCLRCFDGPELLKNSSLQLWASCFLDGDEIVGVMFFDVGYRVMVTRSLPSSSISLCIPFSLIDCSAERKPSVFRPGFH